MNKIILILTLIFIASCSNNIYKLNDKLYNYHSEMLCRNNGGVYGLGFADENYVLVVCQNYRKFDIPKVI